MASDVDKAIQENMQFTLELADKILLSAGGQRAISQGLAAARRNSLQASSAPSPKPPMPGVFPDYNALLSRA